MSFFTNLIVEIWNSLPSAVVFSHNVYTFKRRLAEFNFYRFCTIRSCLYYCICFIVGL